VSFFDKTFVVTVFKEHSKNTVLDVKGVAQKFDWIGQRLYLFLNLFLGQFRRFRIAILVAKGESTKLERLQHGKGCDVQRV